MTRPFFSRDRISHFELFDRHATDALEKMKLRLRAGYPVDFQVSLMIDVPPAEALCTHSQDLASRFTLDSATDFLFGHCVDSLNAPLPYPHNVNVPTQDRIRNAADDFAEAFGKAQHVIASRARVNWVWPLLELFGDKTKDSVKTVNAYLDPILKDALRKAKLNPTNELEKDVIGENETLLDFLVKRTTGGWLVIW